MSVPPSALSGPTDEVDALLGDLSGRLTGGDAGTGALATEAGDALLGDLSGGLTGGAPAASLGAGGLFGDVSGGSAGDPASALQGSQSSSAAPAFPGFGAGDHSRDPQRSVGAAPSSASSSEPLKGGDHAPPEGAARGSRAPLLLGALMLLTAVMGGGYWLYTKSLVGAQHAAPSAETTTPSPEHVGAQHAATSAETTTPSPEHVGAQHTATTGNSATPSPIHDGQTHVGAQHAATSGNSSTPSPKATTPAPEHHGELRACVAQYFPEETFGDPTQDFAFLCSTQDPREAAKVMHRQIVVGGQGKISAGMREWSLFSWYELAAVSTVRHACCHGARPELPSHEVCPPLAEALTSVAVARDAESVDRLEASITCLYDKQVPRPYRYRARPDSGNKTAFLGFIRRAAEAK